MFIFMVIAEMRTGGEKREGVIASSLDNVNIMKIH